MSVPTGTVEKSNRNFRSRDVGCYAGLRPRRSESGESQPQLRITKEGDAYLRKMLVQGAHYILGHRGPDTDLKRWGLKLAARGGKRAKDRLEEHALATRPTEFIARMKLRTIEGRAEQAAWHNSFRAKS
jgi:hypothetical protein